MAHNVGMQYTIRGVPEHVDHALRERARREGKSLNEVAIEVLTRALGLGAEAPVQRELDDVAGTWVEDEAIDDALKDQRMIDPDLWR
jgi:plasmid stability protein